jgi:hypothetical protein
VGSDDGPYATFNRSVAEQTRDVYEGPLSRLGGGPEAVADAIARALKADRPRTRMPVTASARVILGLRRLLPDRIWDRVVMGNFQTPR